ncbi:MAG: hypothetical protein D6756_12810 [Cyanobacteria bacterium J083]|nr:MAG: hypothetical protein D6756_12810 [Cyanobacteria bacterium J083]
MKMGKAPLTANPGDRISDQPQTIEEKAKQIAVDKYDITGSHIQVPTYFVVKYPNGETKALHHVRDAEEISDVIRLMKFQEQEEDNLRAEETVGSNNSGFIVVMILSMAILFLMTTMVLIGIF